MTFNYIGTSYDRILSDENNHAMTNTHFNFAHSEITALRSNQFKDELKPTEDDLGSYVATNDDIYLVHFRQDGKPIYYLVLLENVAEIIEKYDPTELVDVTYYGVGEDFIKEMEELF